MQRQAIVRCATLILIALLARAGWAGAAEPAAKPAAPGFAPEVDAYLTKALRDWEIPGMAVAVVQGDTIIAKGYGVRELGKPGAVDENTVFDAASLTKSFTAALIATLVDEGKMGWDDPVRRHLPQLALPDPYLTENATVRDFLSHRTGLEPANTMWFLTAISRAEVLRRMRCLSPASPFRADMVYSNIGYTVAGEAAAAAGGASWEQLLRDRLIAPLGLRSTTASYEQAERMPNRATSHAWIDGAQRPIRRETQRAAIAAAGDVQSSAADLARWARLHLANGMLDGKRLVSEAAMQEMHSPQVIIPTTPAMREARLVEFFAAYGLGWQVMDYRGHAMLWHSGSGNGQLAYMALLPKERLGVVVLVNTWAAPVVHGTLASYLLDVYLGYPFRDWSAEALARLPKIREAEQKEREKLLEGMRPSSKPPRPLVAYAGQYEGCLYGPIVVRLEGKDLTLQMGEGQKADLLHHHDDTFLVRWRDPLYREDRSILVSFEGEERPKKLTMQLRRDHIEAERP
ncbi:MAG TPA: serine hydrolase [Thermoanaerobaculia bacterium]|jgi:CubicO group peptidase (beta-lactamase class C family)